MAKREFTIANEYRYDRSAPVRWVVSHVLRYPLLPLGMVVASILSNALTSYSRVLVGEAFRWVTAAQPVLQGLAHIAILVAATRMGQAILSLGRSASVEFLAQRLERDCRDELYVSLLGKSLTFHGQQRVGDVMARATNDVRQINLLASPGVNLILDSAMGIVVPIVTMGAIRLELLLVPLIFVVLLVIALRDYTRRLNPVSDAMRQQFGVMNAGLAESISGIEVVKTNAQEAQEATKFHDVAARFRDLYVRHGHIQARYFPFLIYSACFAAALLHAGLVFPSVQPESENHLNQRIPITNENIAITFGDALGLTHGTVTACGDVEHPQRGPGNDHGGQELLRSRITSSSVGQVPQREQLEPGFHVLRQIQEMIAQSLAVAEINNGAAVLQIGRNTPQSQVLDSQCGLHVCLPLRVLLDHQLKCCMSFANVCAGAKRQTRRGNCRSQQQGPEDHKSTHGNLHTQAPGKHTRNQETAQAQFGIADRRINGYYALVGE